MKHLFSKNPLYFVFFLPSLIDGIVTVGGQVQAYWDPATRVVNEASPAYYFLAQSPWLFLIGSVFWYVGWYQIFLSIKNESIKLWLALLFLIGHGWGTANWFVKFFRSHGWWTPEDMVRTNISWSVLIVYFAILSYLAVLCIRVHFRQKTRCSESSSE